MRKRARLSENINFFLIAARCIKSTHSFINHRWQRFLKKFINYFLVKFQTNTNTKYAFIEILLMPFAQISNNNDLLRFVLFAHCSCEK